MICYLDANLRKSCVVISLSYYSIVKTLAKLPNLNVTKLCVVVRRKDMKTTLRFLLLAIWCIDVLSICTVHLQHLTCHKHIIGLEYMPKNVTSVDLRHIEMDILDLETLLKTFPDTDAISIYKGNIQKIVLPKPSNKIKVLKMINIGVETIGNSFLRKFPNLEALNLEGNYLSTWNADLDLHKLKSLYLANNPWNCSLDLEWVLKLNQTLHLVKDIQNLTCFGEPHAKKSLLTIAQFVHDIKKNCPSPCSCSLPKVILTNIDSQDLEPVIEVNCSYRGLVSLPENLLQKTRIMHLQGNEIEDLQLLKKNPVYKKVFEIYLDNNKIKSIDALEGSYFLKHFRIFSLRGNKLSEIPTYAIDNALGRNENMPAALRLTLGGNPWRCDCVFTPVFQEMLQKFKAQIEDINEITCSYVEGDENSLLSILELSRSSVCRSPTEYSVQALDLLNLVLASLIVLILGKLAYDYYYFKKTGQLPWIVTKMP